MTSRLEFVKEVTPFCTVSAIINDESEEHVLSIELFRGSKIVFRGADIDRLHKALLQCDDAFKGLGQAARHIAGWTDQHVDALTDGAGAEAVAEPPALDCDQRHVLSCMMDGSMLVWYLAELDTEAVVIENGHGTLTRHELMLLLRGGYVALYAGPANNGLAARYYTITNEGRRVLAEADDVKPPALDDISASILGHLVDGGTLHRNNITGTFRIERDGSANVHHTCVEWLLSQGLVSEALSSPCSPESATLFVITDKGREALASQEADGGG